MATITNTLHQVKHLKEMTKLERSNTYKEKNERLNVDWPNTF